MDILEAEIEGSRGLNSEHTSTHSTALRTMEICIKLHIDHFRQETETNVLISMVNNERIFDRKAVSGPFQNIAGNKMGGFVLSDKIAGRTISIIC